MKIKYSLFISSVLLLLLAGCASVTKQTPANSTMPDAISQGTIPQQSGEGSVVAPEPKPVMSASPAVIALLDQAQLENKAGRRETAGASLERALRIEPRNPWLWHEL
ncbi:MAG: tetratricopeptide repeat protein, partial [Gallionella sp.]